MRAPSFTASQRDLQLTKYCLSWWEWCGAWVQCMSSGWGLEMSCMEAVLQWSMRCILDLVTQMHLFSLSNTHRAGENDLTCLPEIINIFAQGREPFLSQKKSDNIWVASQCRQNDSTIFQELWTRKQIVSVIYVILFTVEFDWCNPLDKKIFRITRTN